MTDRIVTARCVAPAAQGKEGEGQWVVELPSSPPRRLPVIVAPMGDDPKEKWLARGYDRATERHFCGAGATPTNALYGVVESFAQLMSGTWPNVARTWDPRIPLPSATLVPLASDGLDDVMPSSMEAPPPPKQHQRSPPVLRLEPQAPPPASPPPRRPTRAR
jgi:hypothetical protein